MTARLTIALDHNAVAPGDRITGTVRGNGDDMEIELTLRWSTVGKGTQDHEVVASTVLWVADDRPQRFDLGAPLAPWSFTGTLFALVYHLRAVVDGDEVAAAEVVIAPGGQAVDVARTG